MGRYPVYLCIFTLWQSPEKLDGFCMAHSIFFYGIGFPWGRYELEIFTDPWAPLFLYGFHVR